MFLDSRFQAVAASFIAFTFFAPVQADVPSAATVVSAYQRQSNKQLADLKLALKQPSTDLLTQLDGFSAGLVDMTSIDGTQLEDLAVVLDTAYVAMEKAANDAWTANSIFGRDQMSAMVDPESFDPVTYPMAFYAGGGNVRDRFAAGVTKALDTALVPARKRAAKMMAAVGKPEVGVGLTLQLFTPNLIHNASMAFNAGATTQLDKAPLTVEYVVSGSNLLDTDDGLMLIGGQFDSGAGELSIQRTLGSATGTVSMTGSTEIYPSQKAGHWYAIFGNGDSGGLTEGNYILTVKQGGVPVVTLTVGVP